MDKGKTFVGHPLLAQIISCIPKSEVQLISKAHQSDRYYKKLPLQTHLTAMLYGVLSCCTGLIIDKGQTDDRIRAVLLNGSRANKKIFPDKLEDFDIVYIVTDIESFINDHSWVDYFGERIIWQLPDKMTFGHEKKDPINKRTSFSHLICKRTVQENI